MIRYIGLIIETIVMLPMVVVLSIIKILVVDKKGPRRI